LILSRISSLIHRNPESQILQHLSFLTNSLTRARNKNYANLSQESSKLEKQSIRNSLKFNDAMAKKHRKRVARCKKMTTPNKKNPRSKSKKIGLNQLLVGSEALSKKSKDKIRTLLKKNLSKGKRSRVGMKALPPKSILTTFFEDESIRVPRPQSANISISGMKRSFSPISQNCSKNHLFSQFYIVERSKSRKQKRAKTPSQIHSFEHPENRIPSSIVQINNIINERKMDGSITPNLRDKGKNVNLKSVKLRKFVAAKRIKNMGNSLR